MDINVSVFVGIGNNISICYKFQNDFNDYFQDKNNKNINDYKSIFVSVKNNISIYIVEVFIQIMMIKINILYILVIL